MTNCANRCGIPGLGSDQQRLRLVVMGDSFVGKSSIIKRFLFGRLVKYVHYILDIIFDS